MIGPLCAADTESAAYFPSGHQTRRKESLTLRLEEFWRKRARQPRPQVDRRTKPAVRLQRQGAQFLPTDQEVYHTTVRFSFREIGPKQISEMALYFVGKFLWESRQLDLADFIRGEFLLSKLLGDKIDHFHIKDKRKRDLSVAISLVLKYAERPFEPLREYQSVERLREMICAKTGLFETLESRAHGARSYVWSVRYFLWIELRSEGEADNQDRGKRYSSYTKGYHDGSSLRPTRAEKYQVLDRESYSTTQFGLPSLEIWDAEEFRSRL